MLGLRQYGQFQQDNRTPTIQVVPANRGFPLLSEDVKKTEKKDCGIKQDQHNMSKQHRP